MKYRYYKITHEWAERLGVSESAPRHPDGMHLVTPSIAGHVISVLKEYDPSANPLPDDAMDAIGAIGLSVAEASASACGDLRHDVQTAPDNAQLTTDK